MQTKTQYGFITHQPTWLWGPFDWPGEGEALYEVGPALLRDGEQRGVVRLVLVEVVHHDAHEQLEENVDSEEDEQVQVELHVLHGG